MDVKNPKHIGIVGGMGPQATLQFIRHVLAISEENHHPKIDAEYPRISMESVVLPELTAHNFTDQQKSQEVLSEAVQYLASRGAEVIAIPCNTAHTLHDTLQAEISVPLLNIIEETALAASKAKVRKAYVLGSGMTATQKLYDAPCEKHGIQTVYPSKLLQQHVEELIVTLEKGPDDEYAREAYGILVDEARLLEADAIILGCTELTLIPDDMKTGLKRIDSSHVLAEALVAHAYGATDLSGTQS